MNRYAYFEIVLGAACWGAIGLFTRTLAAGGFSPKSIVAVRVFGAALFLSVIFFIKDRGVFRVRPRHLFYFVGTGIVSVTLFTWCYFSAMEVCSLAVAAILLYTAPVFVVLLSALLWKEPITGRKAAALLLAVFGCTLVSGILNGGLSVTAAGFFLGLGSGFLYALYSIFGRYALAHYSSYTVTVYTFLFASAAALLFLNPSELAAGFARPGMVPAALLLVTVSTVAPYLLYTAGLARVESGHASILACVEPAVATLVSVLIFREPLTAGGAAGIACILGAVWLLK